MAVHPDYARKRISDFLKSETDIPKKVIRDLAIKELQNIKQCTNDQKALTNDELKEYIKANYQALKSDSDKIIYELSKEILPTSVFKYFLKQFGLISLFLVPPFYICIDYTITALNAGEVLTKAVAGIASSLLILALMISSVLASILNKGHSWKEFSSCQLPENCDSDNTFASTISAD